MGQWSPVDHLVLKRCSCRHPPLNAVDPHFTSMVDHSRVLLGGRTAELVPFWQTPTPIVNLFSLNGASAWCCGPQQGPPLSPDGSLGPPFQSKKSSLPVALAFRLILRWHSRDRPEVCQLYAGGYHPGNLPSVFAYRSHLSWKVESINVRMLLNRW